MKENREDVKDVKESISQIKVDVALNKDDLKLHMKRSDKLEQLVEIKDKEVNARIKTIEEKLTVGYLLKLTMTAASGIGVLASTIYAITRLL